MQILRLLAARRAASTITAAATSVERRDGGEDDEGPFFDLDFSSVRASSSSSGSISLSESDSDESCEELDFIISLQRSSSASPLYLSAAAPLKFCASEPPATRANGLQSQQHGARKRGIGSFRTLSFGARKAVPLYGGARHSFARSSSFRQSFARSSFSSTRSFRLSADSSSHATEDEAAVDAAQNSKRAPSREVMRRYLAKISRRLRTAASPRGAVAEARGLRRLRKCRSASSAAPRPSSVARLDDSAVEKQDGIAGAIAHCKESLHRASTSEHDSPLLRSRSDPGKCEAAA